MKDVSANENIDVNIISHIKPDPDTLGSALALQKILKCLGKSATCFCDTEINERMRSFLDVEWKRENKSFRIIEDNSDNTVLSTDTTSETNKTNEKTIFTITVDVASPELMGSFSKNELQNKVDLVIDHHYTNVLFGKYVYVDDKAAATGEIMYNIAKTLNINLKENVLLAKYAYCAIVTDSGSFRYSNTTEKTLAAASELISTGFNFAKLNRLIYQNKSMTQINIERLAYNILKFFSNGRIGMISVTTELKKEAGLEGVEIEGITDIARIIEGVEVGVVIKQREYKTDDNNSKKNKNNKNKEVYKISMRSNDYVNVAEIAAIFGGGGHIHAAGCQAEMPLHELEEKIVAEIEKVLISE